MTSQPQVPGAAAVILTRDETVDDSTGTWSYYSRIKILSQAGRDSYSNVSIEYPTQISGFYYDVTSVAGRTIHADGSVIPFTGKPFDRLVDRSSAETTREKVFTLPAVEVGSIIEYRYSIQLYPNAVQFGMVTGQFIPTFYAQSELFVRSEHFLWHSNQWDVDYTSSLPGGISAVKKESGDRFTTYTIDLQDVMPVPTEPYMPPLSTLEQKVVFYTRLPVSITNVQDFWTRYGDSWSKDINEFIGPSSKLSDIAANLTAGASTPEDKLRKLYTAIQQMENTNFSRERSEPEKKATGIANPKSARDIFEQKRGDDLQLTILFVGLARAAGFNAYIMAVTNRNLSRFDPHFLTFSQLNDDIAIVEFNGKNLFLDPAEPLCPFGQLLWAHAYAGGIRQTATGTAFAISPISSYKASDTRRVANLTIDAAGHESGTVDVAFLGAPALHWRQNTLLKDETALHQELENYLRDLMPKGTQVTLVSVENTHDEDKALVVHFQVSGPFGNFTGNSSFIPAQPFHVNDTSAFPDTKRTLPIEFSYPETTQDAVRLKFPAIWQLDTAPSVETDLFDQVSGCAYHVQTSPNAIILRRDFVLDGINVDPNRYTELRNYYEKVVTRDHAVVLFHVHPAPAPAP